MKNAYSLRENVISASQPCLSGQTSGNSSLRYMQLPPVGLANISGSTGGREKPWAMVQKPSASIALPPQSCASAFPALGARPHQAQVKRSRPAALPQAHSTSIAPLPEILLKQKRPHLDCSRDIGSALHFSGLCFCLFLAQTP